MTAIVTSRVVAEFYRGIDFPQNWDTGDAPITVGMARERVMSVIVLLDAQAKPLAACWQVEGEDERFVRIRFEAGEEDDLLDGLNDDLGAQSLRIGVEDLFATLLWEPRELRPDQATYVRKEVLLRGRYSRLVWNLSTREILTHASDLLFVTRQTSDKLAQGVPDNVEEMHVDADKNVSEDFIVLPADPAMPKARDQELVTQKVLALALAILLAALVIGALAIDLVDAKS